jgi:type VI protein secretion system component VasK
MPTHDSKPPESGSLRLIIFRIWAVLLLILSLVGIAAVAVGAFLSISELIPSGRTTMVMVSVLGVGVGLLMAISMRALKIRSLEELEEESESPILDKLHKRLDTRGKPHQ